MIYCDNSATTLQKPPEVAEAVWEAIWTFGNPGRSFYPPAMEAARAVLGARMEIARLVSLENPMQVAVTSGSTESLNLAFDSLISADDHVITTVLEHNSVLRPLYRLGCELSFLDCDDKGALRLEELPRLLTPKTRFVVCTHGSNLIGSLTDAARLYALCRAHGLILILDVSQTLGCVEVTADMADVLCFTGHKALMGPQGTGGIIARDGLPYRLAKTGGTGADSFARHQPVQMPDLFEAGTHNAHGLAGLRAGAAYINRIGVAAVEAHERALTERFLAGAAAIDRVVLYGGKSPEKHLPVVALNIEGLPAEDLALSLWEGWEIAVRAGSHCAPLAHRRFGTEKTGSVRFSFGFFNTLAEIDTVLEALRRIAGG